MSSSITAACLQELHRRANDTDGRLMFHGTAQTFDAFQEERIGRGQDCNSAMGVHLAEWPDAAGEYAETAAERNEGPEAVVLAVWVPAKNPTAELDYYAFFGYDDDGAQQRDHAGFAALRQELRARGHDTVDYEDGEQVITVALNPEDLTVVARLTPAQAEEVGKVFHSWEDSFDAEARLAAVLDRVAPEPGLAKVARRARP